VNTLELIGLGNYFLSRAQMAHQLKERIDKWDYMKVQSFCTTKVMVTKLKRLNTEWEKIFATYKSDKGFINRIHRELKKLNFQEINDPIKKWTKEEVQMAKKHMKKCSTFLAIKEIQVKTTLRFHLIPVRMATIKNPNNKCW
jgi:hypothetical protein